MLDESRMRVMLDLTMEQTGIDFQDLGFENLRYVVIDSYPIRLFLEKWLANELAVIYRTEWHGRPNVHLFNYNFVRHWAKLCGVSNSILSVYKMAHPRYRATKITFVRWIDREVVNREYSIKLPQVKRKTWHV